MSPKILEYNGIIIRFFSGEHHPIHVHAFYAGEYQMGEYQMKVEFFLREGKIIKTEFKR